VNLLFLNINLIKEDYFMSTNSENAVLSGVDQPVKLSLPKLNAAAVEAIKASPLYGKAANVRKSDPLQDQLKLGSAVTTNGWDTVSICRVTALNERIQTKKTYPESMSLEESQMSVIGNFDAWQIVTGGDGRNVKIKVPMKSGTYVGIDLGKGDTFDLANVSVDVYVKLNYFPTPATTEIKDGSYNLFVNTDQISKSDPIAAVISLCDPSGNIDDINQSILRGLFETWLNKPENLTEFNTLFSTVLINNMGEQSEDYKWLRATSISYAYTDKSTEDSSIFGILCMTNDRPCDTLPNQLPAISLESDDNAIFLINREVYVKYQLMPSLPYVFTDSPDAVYTLDESGTTVIGTGIKLEAVKVGLIDYYPVAESFEMCFDETYIRTTAKIRTNISPGIDTYSIIITKQTLVLGTNDKGEQVMTYEMVGEPLVENSTEIAAWIVVTEVILALIAAVVTVVAGAAAGKIVAIVVGIIVALVVAAVSIVIHVIIAEVIAGGVTDKLPSIEPMVKIATNQIKWPFCTDDAFVLTDIDYSGAIIMFGNLMLEDDFQVVNGRLVAVAV
jgi:hypothetical protein